MPPPHAPRFRPSLNPRPATGDRGSYATVHLDSDSGSDSRKNQKSDSGSDSDSSPKPTDSIPIPALNP